MTNSNDEGDGRSKDSAGGKQPSHHKKTTTASVPRAPRQRARQGGPPPPPRHWRQAAAGVGSGGGIQVGSGAAGGSFIPADISNTRPLKRKASVVHVPPGTELKCAVCKRVFINIKALFGHMRVHPERTWRGCFPPPGFEEEAGSSRTALNIDLNVRPGTEESSSGGDGAEGKKEIDLNKPPTPPDADKNGQN